MDLSVLPSFVFFLRGARLTYLSRPADVDVVPHTATSPTSLGDVPQIDGEVEELDVTGKCTSSQDYVEISSLPHNLSDTGVPERVKITALL